MSSTTSSRIASAQVHPLFLERWSKRAMTGQPIGRDTLNSLLEAARWSPSGGNGQPWRILYALRDSVEFATYLDLLVPFNQVWAKEAGALVLFASATLQEHNGKPSPSHTYDTGAAWMSFALQGSLLGLVVHGIGGFDSAKAREVLHIPAEYKIEAMAVVGHPAPAEQLPEALRAREVPSDRKPLTAIAFEGQWPKAG